MSSTPTIEISELLQRLANGGSLNAAEYEVLRARVAQNAGDPRAPLATYSCRAYICVDCGRRPHRPRPNCPATGRRRCGADLLSSNAPYGRCLAYCKECHLESEVFFGGYQRVADPVLNGVH